MPPVAQVARRAYNGLIMPGIYLCMLMKEA
jgi:hypothetical protein